MIRRDFRFSHELFVGDESRARRAPLNSDSLFIRYAEAGEIDAVEEQPVRSRWRRFSPRDIFYISDILEVSGRLSFTEAELMKMEPVSISEIEANLGPGEGVLFWSYALDCPVVSRDLGEIQQ